MSQTQKKKSKSIIWVVGIITILLVTPIFSYLATTQFILKPIESEEKRAWQSYQENRQLRKKYEERQSILMQVVKAKRARLLAMNTLEAMAENIPNGVTLDALSFIESRNSQGNSVILRGRVSQENASKLTNYADALAKAKNAQAANQPLFSQVMPSELVQVLSNLAKSPNAIMGIDHAKMLYLRDSALNVKRMLEIVEDTDVIKETHETVIPAGTASAIEIVDKLNQLVAAPSTARTTSGRTTGSNSSRTQRGPFILSGTSIIGCESANSILVVAPTKAKLQLAESLVEKLKSKPGE